ncbi:FAD-binding protein [Streptomyces sp. MST-110588]|uniref:FAD-binding oxidoreductase n=1 Tax=Streptomyces sp. MST-110588 TaxID=2833628 RepID=UPI001F5C6C70|nr:FAD-binding protein [Streptomyces sp. MST-110588]UNO39381.1 FAD-binding protein [Streptomyces sp. MST-110588]
MSGSKTDADETATDGRTAGGTATGGLTRRGVLAGVAAAGLAAGATAVSAEAAAATGPSKAAGTAGDGCPAPREAVEVRPSDPRYRSLTTRGTNSRFVGSPDVIRVVSRTEHVVEAVQQAVREGRRIAVRSGGHCFENFVDDPAVRFLIDMSGMRTIRFDPRREAFMVEAGASLAEMYRELYLGWGVAVPAGATPAVGVGGHVLGGGYGMLSRRYGLSVDHLDAVEVVVVDRSGRAAAVVASRDPADPHHELWWAHTGGGGGNFGVVTRYWFRDPRAARGTVPGRLLPRPPESLLTFSADWPWKDMDRRSFTRLVRNHGSWHERNSAPGSPYDSLFSVLMLNRRESGSITLSGMLDATGPGARQRLDGYLAAVGHGVAVRPARTHRIRPWLHVAAAVQDFGPTPGKAKAAYLRRRFTDRQTETVHQHLTDAGYGHSDAALWLVSYGGQVNAVPPGATAAAQRDSILKAIYLTGWEEGKDPAPYLKWVREFYRAVYADTGGVPVPGPVSDGSFVNYPDTDLADPRWNTSGVPWHTLYYKDGYARLQRVKARWDPREEFRHGLSVRPGR